MKILYLAVQKEPGLPDWVVDAVIWLWVGVIALFILMWICGFFNDDGHDDNGDIRTQDQIRQDDLDDMANQG